MKEKWSWEGEGREKEIGGERAVKIVIADSLKKAIKLLTYLYNFLYI